MYPFIQIQNQTGKTIASIEFKTAPKVLLQALASNTTELLLEATRGFLKGGLEILSGEANLQIQIVEPTEPPATPDRTIHLRGQILESGHTSVYLDGQWLDPKLSQQIHKHSPDGFSWGYSGSGPAQLALAICLELYPVRQALEVYQDFKEKHLLSLAMDQDFEITIQV